MVLVGFEPYDDLEQRAPGKYSQAEAQQRVDLAALYRIVDLYGLSEVVYNHITVRVEGGQHILVNPYGYLFSQVTASSLVKVDLDGNIVDPGTTPFGVMQQAFVIHSAIHGARPDLHAVIHLHVPEVVANLSLEGKYEPATEEGASLGEFKFLDFAGIEKELDARAAIARRLGDSVVLLHRNHGLIVCGSTLQAAWKRCLLLLHEFKVKALMLQAAASKRKFALAPASKIDDDPTYGRDTWDSHMELLRDLLPQSS